MQDIDFGKFRTYTKPKASSTNTLHKGSYGKKIFILSITFVFSFTLGVLGGVYISYAKIPNHQLLLNNADLDPNSLQSTESLEEENNILVSNNKSPVENDEIFKRSQSSHEFSELKNKLTHSDNKKVYLIWGKTYQDKMMAYRHGYFLKKQNLPVFLAKSGEKMKLYIGPINGETKAYETLSQVKKWDPFKAAVLHEKTN